MSRKLRTFLRWMRDNGIEYSDGLAFEVGSGSVADIGVRAVYAMEESDLIATIPKQACLTVLTTAAAEMLMQAEIGGGLGLVVALMYEKSLEERSKWYGYLQILPDQQNLPFLWSPEQIDNLLAGTELHKVIKEDRQLMGEDWKESIAPLTVSDPDHFPAKWFTLERYLAAKTLVASRAFQVDEYHGYGMVPLADLFNHKTADEDVHITSVDSDSDGDSDSGVDEPPPVTPTKVIQNGKGSRKQPQPQAQESEVEILHKTKTSHKKLQGKGLEDDTAKVTATKISPIPRRSQRQERAKKSEVPKLLHVTQAETFPNGNRVGKKLKLEKANANESDLVSPGKANQTVKRGRKKLQVERLDVEEVSQGSDAKSNQNGSTGSRKPQVERSDMNILSEVSQRTGRGSRRNTQAEHRDIVESLQASPSKVNQNVKRSRKESQLEAEEVSEASSEAGPVKSELLEMILVKNVVEGSEIFNTYGTLSNAALLHRYGFTEPNNPFDLVNIDLSLVLDSYSKLFTSRYIRRRVSEWRRLGCLPCVSDECEYFEISSTGKPQVELLMLLFIMHLSEEVFETLANVVVLEGNEIDIVAKFLGWSEPLGESPAHKSKQNGKQNGRRKFKQGRVAGNELKIDLESWLLSAAVCKVMLKLLEARDSLYPSPCLDDDVATLSIMDSRRQPQLFHSLRLRFSERFVLKACEKRVTQKLENLLRKSIDSF